MPAAAVIPAPIAYIKIAAVKASVVGSRPLNKEAEIFSNLYAPYCLDYGDSRQLECHPVTLSKLECSNQA